MENFKVIKLKINSIFSFKFLIILFLAFGFCEYENPESTLRCIRLLNGWLIQDKKLVVSDYLFQSVFFFRSSKIKLGAYHNLAIYRHIFIHINT